MRVQYRASLEQDLAAVAEFEPDLAIGTTPVVQKAKQSAIPALYFTNLISARPLMGPQAPARWPKFVNAAHRQPADGSTPCALSSTPSARAWAGIWDETPEDRPEFRDLYRRQIDAAAQSAQAEDMN